MADITNDPIWDDARQAYKYPNTANTGTGINGRGRKRDGTTKTIGGKTVVIGQDVTSQEDETKAL